MALQKNYMFDNYQNLSADYIPNNTLFLGPPPDGVKNIIRGTTPEHFLRVPFLKTDIYNIIVTYKQGYNIVEKHMDDLTWTDIDPNIIYFQFSSVETSSFEAVDNNPCLIQVKAFLNNGDIIESDIYQIKILDVLNDEEILYGED